MAGVPYYAIFKDFLDTRFGQEFFAFTRVDNYLHDVFEDYNIMLQSKVSLKWLNDTPFDPITR
jgi:hypothetical protein